MAIYEYDGSEKAPSQYLGLRVNVGIDGKVKQKWFNFRNRGVELPDEEKQRIRKQAEELDQQWRLEKMLHAQKRVQQRKEGRQYSAYKTGVLGIKMKFALRKKTVGNKHYKHYSPVFIVSGSVNQKRVKKTFSIKKSGFDMAWFKTCQYAAEQYGISQFDHMLKRKPDVRQFEIIHRWQCSRGHDIPLERLPDELLKIQAKEKTKTELRFN